MASLREYRQIEIPHRSIYSHRSPCCCNLERYSLIKWSIRLGNIAILQDCIRITLYSILLLTWNNTNSASSIWIASWLYPHLFICIVVSSLLICHECDWAINSTTSCLEKCQRLFISILCQVPVMVITIAFGIFVLPFIFMTMLSDDFGLDQGLRKNNKLQSFPVLRLLQFILSDNYSIEDIKQKIICSNFYILSVMKSDEDCKYKHNMNFNAHIADIHNKFHLNELTLDNLRWKNIRNFSTNRKNTHLMYAFLVAFVCFLYRVYDVILLIIGYLLYFLDEETWNDRMFTVQIKIVMILFIFLLVFFQCVVILKIVDIYWSYFLLFHLLFDLTYIQTMEAKHVHFDSEGLIRNIETIHELLFESIDQIKAVQNSDVNGDIATIIISYLCTSYKLPINGDITALNEIIDGYNKVEEE